MHTSPVVSLALSYDHTRIFSGDESGAVFCCNLLQQSELVAFEAASSKRRRVEDEEPKTAEQLENEHWSLVLSSQKIEGLVAKEKLQAQKAKFFETQRKLQFPMRVPWTSSFDDYVLCTRQFLEDGLTEVQELRERIENVKNDAAYNIAQKEQEMDEAVSQLREEADKNMAAQASQYAQLSENMEKAQALHAETTAMKHQEMENGQRGAEQDMQNRLTKEYEKQSRLVAEIQALREKNRSDLMSLEESYEAQIEALKKHSEAAMKELRSEYDKVCAMLKTDGLKFEEAMRQQEEEYEAEISDFQDQKRSALQNESERYNGALRDMVSMKNQISSLQSQIVQNQDDLSRSAKQQDELKRKLEEVLDMFRKAQEQLKDREKVIRVKDEALQKLRSNQKHLESFRYVLFHKVQTLEKERDPLEQQVTELKDSVQGMYQEMVQDLRKKQALETRNAEKHFKIQNLVGESNVLARNLKATKKDFKNFITELTGALDIHAPAGGDASQTNNKDPTRLISQLKDVVGRYEGKVNIYRGTQELAEEEKRTGLPAITDEAIRQRDHLMEKSRAMSDATKFEQQLRARDTARFTNDNSELILEMNRLRLEKTQKDRKITELEKSMYALSSEGVGGSVMSGMPSSLLDNSLHNGSSRRGNGSMMASTPYVQRREKDEANKQRVQKRKDGNQLPPKIVTKAGGSQLTASKELHNSSQMLHSFEKEGFQVDKLRQSLPFEGVHEMSPAFDGGAGQDDIYTGGPIAPANKFPPARK
ncbi:unnamed protein product [Amoebophrya sp. A25]|nr:unnamed protein product [Amoebophrya sp. A25]|eukprot:GSA25T00002608001.1